MGIFMDINANEQDIKKVVSIYRIDSTVIQKTSDKSLFDEVVAIIKNCHYNPVECEIKEEFLNEYTRKCFKLSSSKNIGWESFVEKFTVNKLNLSKSKNYSIILLVQSKENNDDIFVIGFGNLSYYSIQNIVDSEFGLDILSRMIEPNDNILKSSKEQLVVGSTQGQLSTYRQLHSLNDIEDFGSIFQELNVAIKKDVLERFGVNTDKAFKNCCAKASFQIKTSISSQTIEKYIRGCEYTLKQPKQPINSSRRIDKKSEKVLYERIKSGAIKKLWEDFSKNIEYDLCHKEFDKYIQADSYFAKYNRKSNKIDYSDTLKNILPKDIEEKDFKNFLDSAFIESYSAGNNLETRDTVFNHLFIEFEETTDDKTQKYFILNGSIYKLEDEFLTSLNNKIKNFSEKGLFHNTKGIKNWNKDDDEDTYNKSYIGKDGYVVIHPFLHKNIELCDFIKIEDNSLNLYFVKDEFSATIRDLAYQIYTTAKMVEYNKNTNYKDLIDIFKEFKQSSEYSGRTSFNEDELVEMFKTKSIKYIFAFRDLNERQLSKEPDKFKSNIAKFALVDLIQKMNMLDRASIYIEQIPI